jgi:hypothetical protein
LASLLEKLIHYDQNVHGIAIVGLGRGNKPEVVREGHAGG